MKTIIFESKRLFFSLIILILFQLSFMPFGQKSPRSGQSTSLTATQLHYKWPLKKSILTSTFGESRGDHFHDGIDLISNHKQIFPIDSGELLYFWSKDRFPFAPYPGGGNYKIIKHSEDLCSIYMHLSDGLTDEKIYTKNDLVGIMGHTGHSFGPHLHFSLLDFKNRTSFNPLLYLQDFKDETPPIIYDLYLRINNSYIMIKPDSTIRLTKSYPLLVKIRDQIGKRKKMGIYGLKAIFNGELVLDVNFKEINYSEKGLTIAGKSFQSLFDEDGFYKLEQVEYRNGENRLKVEATDLTGLKTEKEFFFGVLLDL